MEQSSHRALSPAAAAAVVGGALVVSGLISQRYSPDPRHPRILRWYRALDKPAIKPPDPVFAAGWPVLLTGLGAGAYRLLRASPSRERTVALGLAGLTLGLVTAYNKITFGDRSLTGGVAESGVLVGVAVSYVAVASGVDRTAAALGAPLAAWSAFGGWLTVELQRRNPRLDHGRVEP